jgi:class 3 adenylate cyclase
MTGAADAACDSIRAHLAHGAPWDACDAFRDALPAYPCDPALLYWGALAHARCGALARAHALLDQAEALGAEGVVDITLRIEALSLRGRLWKDRIARAANAGAAAESARRALTSYKAAYALRGDLFPGINAASLSVLVGERRAARLLAREIITRLNVAGALHTAWDHATAGEAQLLLGDMAAAARHYRAAVTLAHDDTGAIASMRRQLRLLAHALPKARDLLENVPAPAVLAFAGHLLDSQDRDEPRFPAAAEPLVEQILRARLAALRSPVVYCSAACGADLLFIEVALDQGAEVNIVLPFDREDFVRTSVAGAGSVWVARFERAMARAARVIMATEESHLGDDVLFNHAACLVEGLAVLRAEQLQTEPSLMCVLDPEEPGPVGGTRQAFERWREHIGEPELIDLRGLRRSLPSPRRAAPPRGGVPASMGATEVAPGRLERTLKTMLFADVAGFGQLHDSFAPLFHARFLDIVAKQIAAMPAAPLEANTWGDALYVVFEHAADGAAFALRLLEHMLAVDWTSAGLESTTRIRIALHTGPVFCGFDPVIGRNNYFGSSVTRAARIEPVTQPGEVYASEAFAATLAADGQHEYALEYVGRLALAKAHGESRIYRLTRAALGPSKAGRGGN